MERIARKRGNGSETRMSSEGGEREIMRRRVRVRLEEV
jgi:hypothetical protein